MKLEKWKNKWKEWSNLRKWQIWKLKLIDGFSRYLVGIFKDFSEFKEEKSDS